MTKIDFYQVNGDEHSFTCRLIDKVYRQGHQIYIHATDASQAQALDEHLWTFRGDAFIPHTVIHQAAESEPLDVPVKIGFDHEPEDHQDVLINLSGAIPHFFSRFGRVAEVVPVDENSRQCARENYAYYKERGYSLKYHEIKG
jgi:DNA polymerase-3 subunit chi